MDNKILPLGLVLISLIAILSYFTLSEQPQTGPPDGNQNNVSNVSRIPSDYIPPGYIDILDMEKVIESSSKEIRNIIFDNLEAMTSCMAFTTRNISFCDLLTEEGDVRSCRWNYNFFLSYFGRCEELLDVENPPLDFKSYCQALASNSCDGLSGDSGLTCSYILENDMSACEILSPNPEYCETGDEIRLFNALKNNDINECQKMSYFYKGVLCESLLNEKCDDKVDEISRDFAYFQVARQLNNLSLCNEMIYDYFKTPCKNGASYSSLFG